MMFSVYKAPAFKEAMKKVLLVAKEKAIEVIPEMARQIFRLIDLDNSGTVSVREITVLKAVMDGILRFGTLTLIAGGAEIPPEEKTQLNHMYPDLLLMDALGQPPTISSRSRLPSPSRSMASKIAISRLLISSWR